MVPEQPGKMVCDWACIVGTACCAVPMSDLLVIRVMDLRAMAAVGAAITLERLVPKGERAARIIGIVAVGAGFVLIASAAGLG